MGPGHSPRQRLASHPAALPTLLYELQTWCTRFRRPSLVIIGNSYGVSFYLHRLRKAGTAKAVPDLGLCRGHERLQDLAISNSTDDSDASWRPQSAIIPPSTARDAPIM